MSNEAVITINGTPLNVGQSLAVRVACTDMHGRLEDDPDYLGDDGQGHRMQAAYQARLKEVLSLMVKPVADGPPTMTEGQQEAAAEIIGRDRRRL